MGLSISEEILKSANMTEEELVIDFATYLYDKERLSFGQAKALCGLNYLAFQKELGKRNILMKYDVEDFEDDLKTIQELREIRAKA